jgi:hypothetical protein
MTAASRNLMTQVDGPLLFARSSVKKMFQDPSIQDEKSQNARKKKTKKIQKYFFATGAQYES